MANVKIILHNSVSIDGSLTNFQPNMELHYQISGSYKPDVHLIGSNTIKTGIETFGDGVPPEEKDDFEKPKRDENLPKWVIIDTKGKLKGMLHACRRFEFCKDVIILLSEQTPEDYKKHLKERNYDYHVVGKNHVDLEKAIELLSKEYGAKTILTDTGRVLGNLLLNQGLIDEISLLVHPIIVGKKSYNMFSDIENSINLKLTKKEIINDRHIWVAYKVKK